MKSKYSRLILGTAIGVSAFLGTIPAQLMHLVPPWVKPTPSMESSVSFADMGGEATAAFAEADQIFVGRVTGFTPSFFVGKRTLPKDAKTWENFTMPASFHYVILQVDESIMGVSNNDKIKVLVPGGSPVDSSLKLSDGSRISRIVINKLKIGDNGIFFVRSKTKVTQKVAQGTEKNKSYNAFTVWPPSNWYFPAQSGGYLSTIPEDIKPGATKPPLYTVADIQQKLKEFEPTRACIQRANANADSDLLKYGKAVVKCDEARIKALRVKR